MDQISLYRHDLPKQFSWHIKYPGTIKGHIPRESPHSSSDVYNLTALINDVFRINKKIIVSTSVLFVYEKLREPFTKTSFILGNYIKENKSLIKLFECFQLDEDSEDSTMIGENFDCCFFSQYEDHKCADSISTIEKYFYEAGIYIEEIKSLYERHHLDLFMTLNPNKLNPNKYYIFVQIKIMEYINCYTPLGSIIYLTKENEKLFNEYILNRDRNETILNDIIFQPKKDIIRRFQDIFYTVNVSILGWCKNGTKRFWYCRTFEYGLIKIYFST